MSDAARSDAWVPGDRPQQGGFAALRHAALAACFAACASPPPPVDPAPHWPTPDLPDDPRAQAQAELARDAWRRDAVFREAVTPGYRFGLTRVDPDRAATWPASALYGLGGELFQLTFTRAEGLGGADSPALRRFQVGRRGGPDALRCADCHWRGGPAGAGDAADNAYVEGDGDTQASAFERNPRGLSGAGWLERLAAEMTAELHTTRDALVASVRRAGAPQEARLTAKGLDFGTLGALPGGSLDTRRVIAVGPDLVVRPFGWKGRHADLLSVVEEELALHHGLQTARWATAAGPALAGPHPPPDPDGDGVIDELSDAQWLGLTAYIALQEVPVQQLPDRADHLTRWAVGEARFRALGCADCHPPYLVVDDPTWTVRTPDGTTRTFDLSADGAAPALAPDPADGAAKVWLFSDLRRHAMGDLLADARDQDGVRRDLFVTPPLWGLTRTAPYLHDGRAPSVDLAILAHGGEAQAARDAYAALTQPEQYDLRLYLATLTRATRLVTQ